jgi:hypothetical protein
MHFLFPADPLDPRRIDESFAAQRDAFRAAGFTTSLVPDRVLDGDGALLNVPPEATAVYRGWMVNAAQYERLARAIADAGATPLTSPEAYLATHHLPRWYPLLADLTPATKIFPPDADLEPELRALGWREFFIKDYVKSLKTTAGSRISDPAHAARVADDMRRYRGEIEGGFCVREVEAFVDGAETRYFVVQGRAFSMDGAVPSIVELCVERIASPFFSVDVTRRADGTPRVVEIGDGQVSDPVGWTLERFVCLFRR